jgi:phosphatidylglycerol:prolipoprotein diacylglycerol transferase
MLPVSQIGPFTVPIYPLSLLLAVWAALAAAGWAARRQGLAGDHIINVGLYGLVAGVAIARLAHVIAFWPAYRTQPLEIVGSNSRAFIGWPGLVAALVVAGWYIRRHRLPWARVVDAGALGALLGASVACLGAFLAGQGLGVPTALPWGVTAWDVPRHPFQLYGMLATLATAGLVAWVLTRQKRPGVAALVALAGCGLAALLIDPARAESLTAVGGLRVVQLLGLASLVLALWGLRRHMEQLPDEAPRPNTQ